MKIAAILLATILLACAFGCQPPAQPAGPTLTRVAITSDEEFDRLWETAADVLRAHNLVPDRQDRSARVITTYPDTSASWFEFWRPFPTSDYGRNESNFAAVRRAVTVQFMPVSQDKEYEMNVEVDVSRYCLVERQVTDSASVFQAFGARLPTTEGRAEQLQSGAYWEPLGRDEKMELALSDRILRRFGSTGYRVVQTGEPDEATDKK